jgi:hypothetical protein
MTKVSTIVIYWVILAWSLSYCEIDQHVSATSFEATGVYVRHLRFKVAPSQRHTFETMMRRLVEAATTRKLPEQYDWLCYRESLDRYWLVIFREESKGFSTPPTLSGFVNNIGNAGGKAARREIRAMLSSLQYETDWEIVFQQKQDWSTVTNMSTETRPKAQMVQYVIQPRHERQFDIALRERTQFLVNHSYPLPVEGFVLRSGAEGYALQVVFAVDWNSYKEVDSFSAFVAGLDEKSQHIFAQHEVALKASVARVAHYNGDFAKRPQF